MRGRGVLLFAVLAWSNLGLPADVPHCPQPVTFITMDRGEYSSMPGAVFGLQHFSARMVARGKTQPLCSARTTQIQRGDVFISSESITTIFKQKMKQSGSKISELQVEVKDDELHFKGKVQKGMNIPFEVAGPVSTDGSTLKLEAKKIKAEHLPVKGLMGMLGMHLSSLLQSEQPQGVIAQGDTLVFEPTKLAHVQGKIAAVRLTTKGIDITFADTTAKQRAAR